VFKIRDNGEQCFYVKNNMVDRDIFLCLKTAQWGDTLKVIILFL
jgi:hypothetical protein